MDDISMQTKPEINHFSPGLHKLIHHTEHLAKIQRGEIVGPIHVSVWPTNKCQLACTYCCFRNVMRNDIELGLHDFKHATNVLRSHGLKAMEFSGGGEPLLWKHFDETVEFAFQEGLKLSLVTNGLLLPKIPTKTLEKFTWIRVSIQSANYARKIDFDCIPKNVRHSASFIVHDDHTLAGIKNLYLFAKDLNLVIRVAPIRPCTLEWEKTVGDETDKYGYPLVFFRKESGTPLGCYMIYLRAAIDWNGNFLPCPSIELGYESEANIPDDFAVCHVSKLEEWLQNNPPHDMGYRCKFCNCGKESNDLIYNLLQPIEDVDFV